MMRATQLLGRAGLLHTHSSITLPLSAQADMSHCWQSGVLMMPVPRRRNRWRCDGN
jgi:hypothetical protein